ncbi:Uncharacterised protein [uncultured archaeon]|nr:Uncharacterised protein [uncultured archaeon]
MAMSSPSFLPKPVAGFLANDFTRILLLLVIFAGFYSFAFTDVSAPIRPAGQPVVATVDFFYLSTCPHCRQQEDFNNKLAAEFPQVNWSYHDMSSSAVQDLSAQMMMERNYTPIKATPITIIGNKVFVGYDPVSQPEQMRQAVREVLGNESRVAPQTQNNSSTPFSLRALDLPLVGQLHPEQMSPLMLSLSLGVLDGFNPCAVWGVIALICMLMLANDWKKMGLLVGAFVFFCAVAHFAFVGGFASPFFVLGIMRYVMTAMGVCALFIGIYQIRAAWMGREKKTHKSFSAPPEKETFGSLLENPVIIALLVGLALMAVLFNSLGSICAAAVPTVYNQAMTNAGIAGGAKLGYLAVYNIMYMVLDAVMLGLAMVLMSGKLGAKVALITQILCALLLTAFGYMLLFAPALLVGG